MCKEWDTLDGGFERFLEHIKPRPVATHTLDRRDPDKGYEPGNVRWASAKEQGRNKRDTKWVTHPTTGKRIKAADLAEELGIRYQSLRQRMMKEGTWE